MLTIITLRELDELLKNMKLEGSISFNFIPPNGASLLKDLYNRRTSDQLGEFFMVKTYDGKSIDEYAPRLESTDDEVFQCLPALDEEYVGLLVNPKSYTLMFGEDSLEELKELNSADSSSVEELKKKIARQRLKGEPLVYAVSSVIRAEEIIRVIYPKKIEGQVKKIAESTKARRRALGKTNIFGQE